MSFFTHKTNPKTGERTTELSLGQPSRLLTDMEMMQLWSQVYGEGLLAPDEMGKYRVIVAWRLTRALASKQGRLKHNGRLMEIFSSEEAWSIPMAALTPTVSTGNMDPPEKWTYSQLLSRDGGLALVPTTDNRAHRARFSSMVTKLSESMGIARGSQLEPRLGEYGLYGLTHPDTIVRFWPSKHELVAWEEELLQVLQNLVLIMTRPAVQNYLQDNFDLSLPEAKGMFTLAIELLRDTYNIDKETDRAIIKGRQEKLYHDAIESGDLTIARGILKDQNQALGQAEQVGGLEFYITAIKSEAQQRIDKNVMQIEVHEEDTDGN